MKVYYFFLGCILITSFCGCNNDDPDPCDNDVFFCENDERVFDVGFSTWPYAPSESSVTATYQFLEDHSDIYSEHIDSNIPWNAWFNGTALPEAFTNDITGRAARRLPDTQLTLSVSLLNNSRDELAFDYDGTVPDYQNLNDPHIEDAYVSHLTYIITRLNPDYLVMALEVNELLKNSPQKWEAYKSLMLNVRERIRNAFPALPLSESITLHNFFQPETENPEAFIEEVAAYANTMDFVAVSFYPFFKNLNDDPEFQEAFDFLHSKINKPIAIAETGHISEDLSVEGFDLFIPGSPSEQNAYLKTLFTNAQVHNYRYVIWWTHRDYNALWETFPDESKDLGLLWISTGLINENGDEKEGFATWEVVRLSKYN